jgi:hypothetical protein
MTSVPPVPIARGRTVIFDIVVYIMMEWTTPNESDQRKIPLHHFTIGIQKPGICASRNQESAQIPGFWIPMVKWCNGIFI